MRDYRTSHILDPLEINKNTLFRTASWPQENPTNVYKFKHFFMWVTNIGLQACFLAELYTNIRRGEYKELTVLISLMMTLVSYNIKHAIFDFQQKKFLAILSKLEDVDFHNFPRQCDEYVRRANLQTMFLIRSFQFLVWVYMLQLIFGPLITGELSMRFSVVELDTYGFYGFYIFEAIAIGYAGYNNPALDMLAMSMISIGCTQFEILREKILNARKWAGIPMNEADQRENEEREDFDEELDQIILKHLKHCVVHHVKILEFCKDVDDVFCYLFLAQFGTSVITICNTFFQFLLEDQFVKIVMLAVYAVALSIQLCLYCLNGEQIIEKSEAIRDACYFSDWYKSNKAVQKTLFIIMERAKQPHMFTAGKIAIVNLVTMTTLMRMSYSYFAIMSTLYSD